MRSNGVYVYVIASSIGVTRVGITDHLARRVGAMRVDSPVPLSLFNSIKLPYNLAKEVEAFCHKELAEFNSHGEWFKIAPETAWACLEKHSNAAIKAADVDHAERQRREDWLLRMIEQQS